MRLFKKAENSTSVLRLCVFSYFHTAIVSDITDAVKARMTYIGHNMTATLSSLQNSNFYFFLYLG